MSAPAGVMGSTPFVQNLIVLISRLLTLGRRNLNPKNQSQPCGEVFTLMRRVGAKYRFCQILVTLSPELRILCQKFQHTPCLTTINLNKDLDNIFAIYNYITNLQL